MKPPDDVRDENAPADLTRVRLACQVLWGTGTEADVVVWKTSQFESRLHVKSSLPASILREGKLLYAA
jgi:hypothetical protein